MEGAQGRFVTGRKPTGDLTESDPYYLRDTGQVMSPFWPWCPQL